jgi:hypothetical protein
MQSVADHSTATRREFLRAGLRGSLLGALALLAVVLGRKADVRAPDARCRGGGVCGGCSVFDACTLAPARKGRRAPTGGIG